MTTFVALLRGINVGGNNILPMQEFRALLTNHGCEDVATYIQSGNAVFRSTASASGLSVSIADGIEAKYGFRPAVLVLTASGFMTIAAANPFAVPPEQENHVHISFLQRPASRPNVARLKQLASPSETFVLTDAAFYLHAPDGIGRSKLAAEVEKCLGVPATGRNLRTVGRIVALLAA
ncbi:MAG: DUF1697 domain-containing protein [Gammaproteobacteria bacterium]|nr:DUF1697 domain-containing protein [Gammaproteobacteria bacterium]